MDSQLMPESSEGGIPFPLQPLSTQCLMSDTLQVSLSWHAMKELQIYAGVREMDTWPAMLAAWTSMSVLCSGS